MGLLDKKTDIEQIISDCTKGKAKAQEKLYKQFFGYGMSIAMRYAYTTDEAHEIINDAYMKVFKNITHFNAKHSFKSWFRVIVVNTAVDYYRKNTKLRLNTEIEQLEKSEYSNEIIDKLSLEDILSMLTELPEKQRIVFNLFEIEGYSHKEIALMLEMSETASRTTLTRAKKLLRKLYIKHFENDESYVRQRLAQ